MSLNSNAQRRSSVGPHPFRWGRGGVRSSLGDESWRSRESGRPFDGEPSRTVDVAPNAVRELRRFGTADRGAHVSRGTDDPVHGGDTTRPSPERRFHVEQPTRVSRLVFHVEQTTVTGQVRASPRDLPKRTHAGFGERQSSRASPTWGSRPRLLDATSRQLHPNESLFLNHHSDETSGCGWVGETTT